LYLTRDKMFKQLFIMLVVFLAVTGVVIAYDETQKGEFPITYAGPTTAETGYEDYHYVVLYANGVIGAYDAHDGGGNMFAYNGVELTPTAADQYFTEGYYLYYRAYQIESEGVNNGNGNMETGGDSTPGDDNSGTDTGSDDTAGEVDDSQDGSTGSDDVSDGDTETNPAGDGSVDNGGSDAGEPSDDNSGAGEVDDSTDDSVPDVSDEPGDADTPADDSIPSTPREVVPDHLKPPVYVENGQVMHVLPPDFGRVVNNTQAIPTGNVYAIYLTNGTYTVPSAIKTFTNEPDARFIYSSVSNTTIAYNLTQYNGNVIPVDMSIHYREVL
jgi:hypothetical protein